MLGRSAGLVLVAAISTMGNAAAFELRHICVSTSAFQANSGVSHRRAAYVSCRRTRFFHLSDASGPALHIGAGAGSQSEQALQSKAVNGVKRVDRALLTDEHIVQKMPLKPLEFKGVGAMPHCKSEAWKARITHVLDGMSALFSLGCVSATLACMGILEWRYSSLYSSLERLRAHPHGAFESSYPLLSSVLLLFLLRHPFEMLQSTSTDSHKVSRNNFSSCL